MPSSRSPSAFAGPTPDRRVTSTSRQLDEAPSPRCQPYGGRVTVRLIASDIDGTILRSDNTISRPHRRRPHRRRGGGHPRGAVQRPAAPVDEADRRGHRPPRPRHLRQRRASLYDLHTEEVVESFLWDHEIAADRRASALQAAIPDVAFAVERHDGFGSSRRTSRCSTSRRTSRSADLDELLVGADRQAPRPPPGDVGRRPAHAPRTRRSPTSATRRRRPTPWRAVSSRSPRRACRRRSRFEKVAAEHGITAAEVVAFGDMPNDIPMLSWAGLGVAVANAHEEAKAVADEVTLSNDDDGVAVVIERFRRR